MRKIVAALFSLIFMFNISPAVSFANSTQMRAVWISTVTNLDFPSSQNLSADEQKTELTQMLDKLKDMGINTVVFQVRPCGDALYKSDINPWSQYLTGTQGKDPGYDPLAFAVDEAHKRGMELHAWLNPYRITMKGSNDISLLSEDNPARLHPDWVIDYNDMLTFNPAESGVKQLICDTVKEIVTKYDIDAIHFDDYFYPANYPLAEGESADGTEAGKRREDVNEMVKMVSDIINTYASDVEFGISPMGIWKNAEIDGYQIKGSQSYYTVFGDTMTWIKNGWIDYVVPQIYWEDSHQTASYSKLVKWWNDAVNGTGVKLYIGEGIYKDVVANEIGNHFDIDSQFNNVEGNMFFRAKYLLNSSNPSYAAVKNKYNSTGTDNNQNTADNKADSKAEGNLPDAADKNENSVDKSNRPVVKKTALPTSSNVKIDGTDTEFEAYNIDGFNYFKLRDIACALSGSSKQFDTVWNSQNESITLDIGKEYNKAGGELTAGNGKTKDAYTSTAKVYVSGTELAAEAYNIDGMNYYKLRDVAKAIDFGISWNDELNSIGIFTVAGYEQ